MFLTSHFPTSTRRSFCFVGAYFRGVECPHPIPILPRSVLPIWVFRAMFVVMAHSTTKEAQGWEPFIFKINPILLSFHVCYLPFSPKGFVYGEVNSNSHILCVVWLGSTFISLYEATQAVPQVSTHLFWHEFKRETPDLDPERRMGEDDICSWRTFRPST